MEAVAEKFEIVQRQLLHLMRCIAALKMRSEGVALDGLGKNHRGLSGGFDSSFVGGEHLAIVVSASLQAPDLIIRPVLDELCRARVSAEEVFADESAVLCLVGLEVTIGRGIHEIHERAITILCEQLIPLATPDDLEDVPAGTAEERFQLLDDLAVAAHRSVEALKVAVDDEDEVVEFFARGQTEGAHGLDLIHFTVPEEGPDALLGRVL